MSSEETPYDRVPYMSLAFRETHPNWLEAVGYLFGMKPASVDRSRVLELGCAAGGNLLPMAAAFPDARFLGIDLSSRQIEEGSGVLRGAGLANVELRHQSILDFPEHEGPFDYIICHGVFSWVPPQVQEKVLEICHKQLAPQGIAYISFNTYPGWHVRMWAREMMLYHAAAIPEESRRAKEGIDFLRAIVESPSAASVPALALLKAELAQMADKDSFYLLHEYLEEHNHPLYFHEFVGRCASHGLQYLGDARSNGVLIDPSSQLQRIFNSIRGDIVRLEQYSDFVRNQMFRRSLVCHEDLPLERPGGRKRLMEMAIASGLAPDRASGTVVSDQEMRFTNPGGTVVRSAAPLIKTALFLLHEAFPAAMRFEDLCGRVRMMLRISDAQFGAQREDLAEALFQYWLMGIVEAFVTPPRFATALPEKPAATPLARFEAAQGERVTTLRHETFKLHPIQRRILQLCDGTRTREQIGREVGLAEQKKVDEVIYGLVKGAFLLP